MLVAVGALPVDLWAPAIAVGSVGSLGLLLAFFHPWLLAGIAIGAGNGNVDTGESATDSSARWAKAEWTTRWRQPRVAARAMWNSSMAGVCQIAPARPSATACPIARPDKPCAYSSARK